MSWRLCAKPNLPSDLLKHRAVMCRSQITGSIIPWTLQSAGETVQIAPPAAAIVHDLDRADRERSGNCQCAGCDRVRSPRRWKVVTGSTHMVLPVGGALPLLSEPSSPISGIARVHRLSEGCSELPGKRRTQGNGLLLRCTSAMREAGPPRRHSRAGRRKIESGFTHTASDGKAPAPRLSSARRHTGRISGIPASTGAFP
jgi:hypothetical protein